MGWLGFKRRSAFVFFLPFESLWGLEEKKVSIWVNTVVFLAHIIYQKSSNFGNHKIYPRACENTDSWAFMPVF